MAQKLLAGGNFCQQNRGWRDLPESFSSNQKCIARAGLGEGDQAGTSGLVSRIKDSCQSSLCTLPDQKRNGTPPATFAQKSGVGKSQKKRPGAKAAAAKAKAKAGAKRRFARPEAEPPHIKRSIHAVLNVLAELMWSPTATYLDVCLELFLSRVANVWEEPRFCEYFIQTYCQKHAVEQSVYGQPEIWMPEWWSGVAAQRAGFLSSQQPAEEINCSPDA